MLPWRLLLRRLFTDRAVARFLSIMEQLVNMRRVAKMIIGILQRLPGAVRAHLLPSALMQRNLIGIFSTNVTLQVEELRHAFFTSEYKTGTLLSPHRAQRGGQYVYDRATLGS